MKYNGKSSLFLMELMIALLIFAVCTCVCAAIIAKAGADINESRDMSNALIIAQNRAELIKGGRDTTGSTEYFNSDLFPVAQEYAEYSVVSTVTSEDGGVTEYTVEVFRKADNKLIWEISSAFYAS